MRLFMTSVTVFIGDGLRAKRRRWAAVKENKASKVWLHRKDEFSASRNAEAPKPTAKATGEGEEFRILMGRASGGSSANPDGGMQGWLEEVKSECGGTLLSGKGVLVGVAQSGADTLGLGWSHRRGKQRRGEGQESRRSGRNPVRDAESAGTEEVPAALVVLSAQGRAFF